MNEQLKKFENTVVELAAKDSNGWSEFETIKANSPLAKVDSSKVNNLQNYIRDLFIVKSFSNQDYICRPFQMGMTHTAFRLVSKTLDKLQEWGTLDYSYQGNSQMTIVNVQVDESKVYNGLRESVNERFNMCIPLKENVVMTTEVDNSILEFASSDADIAYVRAGIIA